MTVDCRRRRHRVGLSALVPLLLLVPASVADVWVLCDVGSGEVVFAESVDDGRRLVMDGPFPGDRTATVWVEEKCPARRCDASGACAGGEPPPRPAESWLVVCDPGSGAVGVLESPPPPEFRLLHGPDGSALQHPDRGRAQAWAEESCPSGRCDSEGRCVGSMAIGDTPSSGGGWIAGEVSSLRIGGSASDPGTVGRLEGPGTGLLGPSGPSVADLGPLVSNTKAAAKGCNYPAALASIDHMANFDPQHPFLLANSEKLRSLARRQRQTEQTVWQASSTLQAGNLKVARGIARKAGDTAVACQNQAVAVLLDGIDTAIKQTRELKRLKRGQAASRLLPGLVSLSYALSGAQSGVPIDVEALLLETASQFGADLPLNALDPCAFKYEYRDTMSLEPSCACPGYRFDPGRFRCVE